MNALSMPPAAPPDSLEPSSLTAPCRLLSAGLRPVARLLAVLVLNVVVLAPLFTAPARAQDPGDLFAQGFSHLTGQGAPRDATRAATLFLEAAKSGEPQSQFQLGVMHMEGLGVPKDNLWARFWLGKAVESPALPGDARQAARGRIDALDKMLTPGEKRRLGL